MRYLLFGGYDCYYAKGGSHDLLDSSDNADELVEKMKQGKYTYRDHYGDEVVGDYYTDYTIDWWHIYDLQEGKIITGTEHQPYGAPDLEVFENE